MVDYYKGSPMQDVRDYSGGKKKKKKDKPPVYEQGELFPKASLDKMRSRGPRRA